MDIEQKAVELVDKIASALESAAKPATELALRAIRLEAIVNLSLCLLATLVSLSIALFIHRKITKDDWDSDAYILVLVLVLVGAVAGGVGIGTNLIGAVDPAAALALKVIHAVK